MPAEAAARADEQPPQRDLNVNPIPGRLYIECTAACNISCNQAICAPETGITRTRQAGMLDFDLFTKVIDEAGPTLGRIDFFNYGEAFLHKRAVEMCEYIKTKFPHIYLYTSTNGLAFTEEKVRQLARSGIDEVTFSIDGSSQENYVKYRQRGNFDKAIANMRFHARRARQDGQRPAVRQLALHPVQVERLRRRDGPRARDGQGVRRRSAVLGDHRSSRGFVLAALRARAHLTTIASATRSGTTAVSATRFPARHRALRSTSTPCLPDLPFLTRPSTPVALTAHVKNVSGRPFRAQTTQGRRVVRLGAQLIDDKGTLINLDHARAWLPGDLGPGRSADVRIEVTAPEKPGRYALKFDLVAEGVDWFESCGSPTITRELWVR